MSRTLSTGIRQWGRGDVSLRPGRFLITPSGLSRGALTEDQLAKVDFAGRPLVGADPLGKPNAPGHLSGEGDVQAICSPPIPPHRPYLRPPFRSPFGFPLLPPVSPGNRGPPPGGGPRGVPPF